MTHSLRIRARSHRRASRHLCATLMFGRAYSPCGLERVLRDALVASAIAALIDGDWN